MASEEAHEALREPCPCGVGEVVLVSFTPDHMYGKVRFEHDVTCAACRIVYEVRQSGYSVTLDRRDDREQAAQLDASERAAAARLQREVLAPLREALASRARALGATYDRWFEALRGPMSLAGTAAAMRAAAKPLGGFEGWLRENVTEANAAALAAALAIDVPVASCLATLAAHRDARRKFVVRSTTYGSRYLTLR